MYIAQNTIWAVVYCLKYIMRVTKVTKVTQFW